MKQEMASNIAKMRMDAGYNQQQVADFLGVSRVTYQGYESGRVLPNIWQADKMCVLFDCTVYDLYQMESQSKYNYEMKMAEAEARHAVIEQMIGASS